MGEPSDRATEEGFGVTGTAGELETAAGELAGGGRGGVDGRACPFSLIRCARGGSSALDAEDTGEMALSLSTVGAGDCRDDVSTSPLDRGGDCGSEASTGVGTAEP